MTTRIHSIKGRKLEWLVFKPIITKVKGIYFEVQIVKSSKKHLMGEYAIFETRSEKKVRNPFYFCLDIWNFIKYKEGYIVKYIANRKKKISEKSLKSKLVKNENFLQTEISDDISSKKCYLIQNRK